MQHRRWFPTMSLQNEGSPKYASGTGRASAGLAHTVGADVGAVGAAVGFAVGTEVVGAAVGAAVVGTAVGDGQTKVQHDIRQKTVAISLPASQHVSRLASGNGRGAAGLPTTQVVL